jgi:hypothetical protein
MRISSNWTGAIGSLSRIIVSSGEVGVSHVVRGRWHTIIAMYDELHGLRDDDYLAQYDTSDQA